MFFGRTFLYISALLLCSVFAIHADDNRGTQVSFERLGPFGGDVRSLLMDAQQPQIVYLGTSSGKIFKSTDGGDSWTALNPGIGHQEQDNLVPHNADVIKNLEQ